MVTTIRRRATMFTTPSDRELVATHIVAAPRALVFELHVRPEHVQAWMLGPEGWTMPVCELDPAPGGAWRYVWRREDGAEMEMRGVFREVVPPARIVTTESWGGDWPDTVNTTILTQDAGRTTITCPSSTPRDGRGTRRGRRGWRAGGGGATR
jgi:uncharacterized protein YndB with AHSA1/START domain